MLLAWHTMSVTRFDFLMATWRIAEYSNIKNLGTRHHQGISTYVLWYCDSSYICSSASGVSALLVCTALVHPQITYSHCSKFSVAPLSMWTSQNSSTVSPSSRFWFSITQACWQVSGQLQLHCLSRLNAWFIPCDCAFTFLSLLIIFTADTSSSSCPCCSVKCMQL